MRCAYRLSLLCRSSRQARVDFETARTILLTDSRFSGTARLARLEPEIFHVGAQRNAAVAIAASASRLSISYWQALSRRSEARLRKVAAKAHRASALRANQRVFSSRPLTGVAPSKIGNVESILIAIPSKECCAADRRDRRKVPLPERSFINIRLTRTDALVIFRPLRNLAPGVAMKKFAFVLAAIAAVAFSVCAIPSAQAHHHHHHHHHHHG